MVTVACLFKIAISAFAWLKAEAKPHGDKSFSISPAEATLTTSLSLSASKLETILFKSKTHNGPDSAVVSETGQERSIEL